MRTSTKLTFLRQVIMATLFMPFAVTANAQDGVMQVEIERKIDIEVAIEPQTLELVRAPVELKGQPDPVAATAGTLDIVITPDRKLKEKAPAKCTGGLFCAFEKATTAVGDVATKIQKSTLEPEIIAVFDGLNAGTLDQAKQLHGNDTTMNVSFRNDPEAAGALAEAGYEELGVHGLKFDGESFRMTRWSKFAGAGGDPEIGTATSRVNIRSDANIDFGASAFRGTFNSPEDISFELVGPPADAAQTGSLAQQYENYQSVVRSRLSDVLAHLNEPRQLLSEKETEALFQAEVGETLTFSKRINFDWFGERKTVNVEISATVSSDTSSTGLDSQLLFFEEDGDWPAAPDAADAIPLPPTELEIDSR